MVVRKYVDCKGSAVMLAAKKSAGVTPEVNMRNPLHVGEKSMQVSDGIRPLALKPRP